MTHHEEKNNKLDESGCLVEKEDSLSSGERKETDGQPHVPSSWHQRPSQRAKAAYHFAISSFQSSVPIIKKDGEVNFKQTKYSFETFESLLKAIRPFLGEYGLSFTQEISYSSGSDDRATVVTTISWSNGEISHSQEHLLNFNRGLVNSLDAKAAGSGQSYMRRYAAKIAFGLAVSDDDDEGYLSSVQPASEEDIKAVKELADQLDESTREAMNDWLLRSHSTTIDRLTINQVSEVKSKISAKLVTSKKN